MCAHLLNVRHSAAVKVCLECKKEKGCRIFSSCNEGKKNGSNVKTAHSLTLLTDFVFLEPAFIFCCCLLLSIFSFFLPSSLHSLVAAVCHISQLLCSSSLARFSLSSSIRNGSQRRREETATESVSASV